MLKIYKATVLIVIMFLLSGTSLTSQFIFEVDAVSIVYKVIDGDTFDSSIGRVRLADINAPEASEPGYYEAKHALSSLILDKMVYLDIDDKYVKDKYGRYVCVVYVRYNETHLLNVNLFLAINGYAIIVNYDNEFNPYTWRLHVYYPEPKSTQETVIKTTITTATSTPTSTTLTPTTGNLAVYVKFGDGDPCSKCSVYIDGVNRGFTDDNGYLKIEFLPIGIRNVEAVWYNNSFKYYGNTSIHINGGKTVRVELTMHPLDSCIMITNWITNPEEANPGDSVTITVYWIFLKCCNCIVKANAFGSWNTDEQLAIIYDGGSMGNWHQILNKSFTIKAPGKPGNYHVRVGFAYDYRFHSYHELLNDVHIDIPLTVKSPTPTGASIMSTSTANTYTTTYTSTQTNPTPTLISTYTRVLEDQELNSLLVAVGLIIGLIVLQAILIISVKKLMKYYPLRKRI
ncbi:MAG: thermonuclease family protein [Candidatus Methanomethylicia archaeon]